MNEKKIFKFGIFRKSEHLIIYLSFLINILLIKNIRLILNELQKEKICSTHHHHQLWHPIVSANGSLTGLEIITILHYQVLGALTNDHMPPVGYSEKTHKMGSLFNSMRSWEVAMGQTSVYNCNYQLVCGQFKSTDQERIE